MTARKSAHLGKRRTLRGGALGGLITSLRKKILAAPSEYKTIVLDYIEAAKPLRSVGKPATDNAKMGQKYRPYEAGATYTFFKPVKDAWDNVVTAQTALSNAEKIKISNINAKLPDELKTDPIKKAAYLSGATSAVLEGLGVILAPVAAALLFTLASACFVVGTVATIPVAILEFVLMFVTLGGYGMISDLDLTKGITYGTASCFAPLFSGGGRGGANKELQKVIEVLAKKSASAGEAMDLKEAISAAAVELKPLQEAYNAALLEGIAALQIRYGNSDLNGSSASDEIEKLPDFPVIKDTKSDISTRMAIAAVTAAAARTTTEPSDEKENRTIAREKATALASKLAAAAPGAAPKAAAPEPEPEPEPEATAPKKDCWTKKSDDTDNWYEKEGEASVWELPEGAEECGQGGRRRRIRGGNKPVGPKPVPVAGRRTRRRRQPRRKTSRRKQ